MKHKSLSIAALIAAGALSATGADPSILPMADATATPASALFRPVTSTPVQAVAAPYTNTFDNAASLDGFTIIDANSDNTTWTWENDDRNSTGAVSVSYNTKLKMDDWLISPPIHLEAGKIYTVSIDARSGDSSWKESVEVMMGNAPTVAAMTETIVPEIVKAVPGSYTTYKNDVSVTQTGDYYIGIHGTSIMNRMKLWVDNLKVSSPREAPVPDGVTDLKITPAADGSLNIDITFKAPATTRSGEPLDALERIEVLRADMTEPLKVFDNPTPGCTLSLKDEVEKYGFYEYSIAPYSAAGLGKIVTERVFAGVGKPMEPSDISVTETQGNPGEITISWTAPTTDTDRNPLPADKVTYTITEYTNGHPRLIAENLKSTSHTYQACGPDDDQSFKTYGVASVTTGGSLTGFSPTIAVGRPYSIPYSESFTDGVSSSIFATSSNGAQWSIGTSDTFTEKIINGADEDNGYLCMRGSYIDTYASIVSGKIDIGDTNAPELSFYTYRVVGTGPNNNELAISINDGEKTTLVRQLVIDEDCAEPDAWNRIVIPMDAWKGKTIQFSMTGILRSIGTILVDNITLRRNAGNNLALTFINAPSNALPGEPVTVRAGIANTGNADAGTFSVTLTHNGRKLDTHCFENLEAGRGTVALFELEANGTWEAENRFAATIDYEDDDPSDNTGKEAVVTLYRMPLPAITGLSADTEGNPAGVSLSWAEPDYRDGMTGEITETFENASPWATTGTGDWTFIDADGLNIGGFIDENNNDLPFPGIYSDQPYSFWVMDASNPILDSSFAAHTGKQYLAQMYVLSPGSIFTKGVCDDWAISPQVSTTQSSDISFWARSYDPSHPESMEIMASSSGRDITAFSTVNSIERVAGTWTHYTATLPDGTKYFALRCTSADGMALFIDDISYTPAEPVKLELSGYNVYCDGKLVNETPVTDTGYIVTGLPAVSDHRLSVSAVYDKGESIAENIDITTGSIATAVSAHNGVRIEAQSGRLTISDSGNSLVTVSALDGKILFCGKISDSVSINVVPGVYIVTCGNSATKVMAR